MKTFALAFAVLASTALASAHPADLQERPSATQVFEHYEAIRVALAADRFSDVAPHARRLASVVEPLGGVEARTSADALVSAATIEDARKHFGDLSEKLVPVFQAAAIPGTYAYICSMKERSWMQRGKKVENPYYGKAMLACGSPLPAGK